MPRCRIWAATRSWRRRCWCRRLQTLVAREVDPVDKAVISVTRIAGGEAYNVVPERVELWGTIRTFRDETRATADPARRGDGAVASPWRRASTGTGSASAKAIPPRSTRRARRRLGADAAAEIVGEAQVDRDPPPCMGSEDFAFMLQQRPGSYIWMGTGARRGRAGQLHSPYYDFNDEALPLGVSYWVRLVERLLPKAA